MRSKKKSMEQLTSALMAIMMAVSTTISPAMTLASEMGTLSAIESQTIEEETIAEDCSSVDVQEGLHRSICEENATQENAGLEISSSIENENVSDGQVSEAEVVETEATVVETTTEVIHEEEEETLSLAEESFEEFTEESSANEPRAPDEGTIETEEEDQLAQKFGFDYDAASDLEVCEYLHGLSEIELAEFVETMTSEQYLRYLSIKEMMEEMNEKDFHDVVDETDFTADRVWDFASYDAFAEAVTGVSLQRTDQTMQFYNTYVDPSQVQTGVTTIDGLLNSNADWYSNEYILGLNPQMCKETVPVYHGSDGSYYVISMVPSLNGIESADYQPATSFYNGSVEAQAFTDIEYLGNGVYRIPSSRYQYCFTEQYVSDMGTLYGISFGLRIQVLYGFTSSGEVTIAADVLYPDMTERFLPATLNLLAGTATVRIFNNEYEDSVDNYLVSASINRGASLPESMGSKDNGKTIQFVVNDAAAVGSLDILLGYSAISKYSMAAQVTTAELYSNSNSDSMVSRAAKLYQGEYLKLADGSVPKNLKVGDKFIYANTGLTIVGVETSHDLSYGKNPNDPNQGIHVGAKTIPTHDAQSFCFYNGKGDTALNEVKSWFRTKLNTTSADPGYMVQMTEANISARASWNGTSVNLGGNKIFGYMTDGLGTVKDANGNTLNLEGTNVLLSCMHAWGNESATTPQDIVDSISSFTGRTQKDFANDMGFGHYKPNIALQCTSVKDGADGYTYATFKVLTSMLKVGGVTNAQNYQCAFSTLRIAYENPKTGFVKIHKTSTNPQISNGNSCYTFKEIQYGIYSDSACKTKVATVTLDENGDSTSCKLNVGTYYVKETSTGTNTGYKLSNTSYKIEVTAGTTADTPIICKTTNTPLSDPFGLIINKINSDGSTTADLSGAEYTIKFYAGQYNAITKLPTKATYTWVIKTVKATDGTYQAMLDDTHVVSGTAVYGKSSTGMYAIPLGTITVEETKAPAGFTVNGAIITNAKTNTVVSGTNNVYLFQLVDDKSGISIKNSNAFSTEIVDKTAMTFICSEVQKKAGISIQKYDSMTSGVASGNADLSGIKFAIVNSTGSSITYADRIIADGSVIMIITTDAKGYAATGKSELPIGKYTVKELRKDATLTGTKFSAGTSDLANNSYLWRENQITVTLKDENANAVVSAGTVYNTPITAIPKFEKYDFELNKKTPMAGTTFKGVVLDIYNNSNNPVVIANRSYAKDTVIASTTADENGNFSFSTKLPIGDYYVKEKQANNFYLTSAQTRKFSVVLLNGKGAISYENGLTSVVFSDRVIRGDFSFSKKKADDNSALAYIPFKITNNATGETHYIMTDANGNFNSANGKTKNTNANDKALSKYGPKDIIPQSVMDSLTKNAGLWFGLSNENTMTTANDSYGALVCGTYTITEMKTEATQSMTMISKTVTIRQDAQTVPLGDLLNVSVKIRTTLTDDMDNDHYAKADSTVNLTDVVEYQNLSIGKVYTIQATLYIKEGSTLTKYTEKTATFQPTSKNGTTKVLFNNISTKGLAGKALVCYEELTCDGEFIAEHKNPNDEGQTVHFPTIHTTAVAQNTSDHIAQATKSLKITDMVTMTSLCVGDTYKIIATLMDKASGKTLKVNGVEVVVTKSFTANNTTMQVPIVFVLDASTLAGTVVVAFETLSFGTTVIATHEDIDDQDQTVYLPSIKTTAKDAESKTNYAVPKENVEIVDTVRYSNLLPGKTYKLTGKLMSKATGKVVTVKEQEITVTKTFTASESGSGTVEMSFKFDATGLTGTFVVFETIFYNDVIVVDHEDINDTDQTVHFSKLTVLKLSQDDEYVIGAKLEIRDSKGKVVEAFESEKNGDVFYRLAFDTEYTLVETEAPEGFFVADPITFQLKENGKVLVNGEEQDELVMVDEASNGYLEVTKQSLVSKKLLPGAVYGVYSDETCTTLVVTLETDENGTASALLEHGTYWVKEIKAPKGYRFDYTVYGPYEIKGGQTTSATLYDVPIPPVPTGIIMTFWPYMAVMGVGIVVFVGLMLLKKHKREKE